jgi:dolichyl-phosphate beta-glucosyltransferase
VDDGSDDDTLQMAERIADQVPVKVRPIRYEQHTGKGHAVRTGILASTGDFVMFADSGLCVPYEYTLKGLDIIKRNIAPIAHGSRKLPESIIPQKQPLMRRIVSKLIRWILILWVRVPARLTDTQCGFKIYRGNVARELYASSRMNGFLFDVEIIIKAIRKGYRIKEFPIKWRADLDSRLSVFGNAYGILVELMKLKKILKT